MSYNIKIRPAGFRGTDPLYLYYNNRITLSPITQTMLVANQTVFEDPVTNDPSLYVYPPPGPFGAPSESDPDVVWSLGGRADQQVNDPFRPPPPVPRNFNRPSLVQLREFVTSVGPEATLLGHNVLQQQSGRYLISDQNIDVALVSPEEVNQFTTFPNQLMASVIKTCESVFYMLKNDSNEIRLGHTTRIAGWAHSKDVTNNIVRTFLRNLFPEATEQDIDNRVRAFMQGQEDNLREIAITYCANGIMPWNLNLSEPGVHQVPAGAHSTYSIVRVVQALLSITPAAVIKNSFDSSWTRSNLHRFPSMSKNVWMHTHFSSSFVKTYDTYRALDRQGRTATSMAASLDPEYNFYIKNYEEAIDGQSVSEGVLPNIYIRNLYTRNLQILRDPNNIDLEDPDQLYGIENYKYIIELGPPPKTEPWLRALQSRGRTEFEYYSMFGSVAIEAEENVKDEVTDRTSTLIFPSTQLESMRAISQRKNVPPMNIEVGFNRSNWGPAAVAMEENKCSAPVLLALASTTGGPNLQGLYGFEEYDISINYINRVTQDETSASNYGNTTLKTYDWETVFGFGQNNIALRPDNLINHTIFAEETGNEDESEWQDLSFGFQTRNCLNAVRAYVTSRGGEGYDRYGAMITPGILPTSEAIAYSLFKQKIGDPQYGQNIMIGNGSGNRQTSYVDTQIKYNEGYYYTLYEYRMIYGQEYQIFMTCPDLPLWLVTQYLGIETPYDDSLAAFEQEYANLPLNQYPLMKFNGYVASKPSTKILQIPIYDPNNSSLFPAYVDQNFVKATAFGLSEYTSGGGIAYPVGRVMDRPPTAASMTIMPIRNNDSQIIINMNLETGAYLNENSQPYVAIGAEMENMDAMHRHQKSLEYYELPEGNLEFKNEGITQVKRVILYRTTVLNLDVEDYNSLYRSFDPLESDSVVIRSYTTNENISQQNSDYEFLAAYDLYDDLEPNQIYYYTCVVEDIHDQVSNPSNIFSVRLISEKGFLVPEIRSVSPKKISNKKPTKDLARYIQVDASNVQSFPYVYQDGEQINGQTSLGQHLGKGISEKDFILRFTSKDSGRKFDLKLKFVVNVDGEPING